MIPSKVKVSGVSYTVEEKDFIEIDGNRNFQGVCDYGNTEISVLKELSEERKGQTFVHELLHAIFHEAGYEEQDEEMITRVSIVLHQVLKDNNFRLSDEGISKD